MLQRHALILLFFFFASIAAVHGVGLVFPIDNKAVFSGPVLFQCIDDDANLTLYSNASGTFTSIVSEDDSELKYITNLTNATIKWNCEDSYGNFASRNYTLYVSPYYEHIQITQCPSDTPGAMLFGLFIIFGVMLMLIGFTYRSRILVMLSGFDILVMSLYMSTCMSMISILMFGLGLIMIIIGVVL